MKSYNSQIKKRSLHNKKTKLNIKTKKSSKKFNKNGMKGGSLTNNNINRYKHDTVIDLSHEKLDNDDVDKIIELLKPKLKLSLSNSHLSDDNMLKIITAAIGKKIDSIIFTYSIPDDDTLEKINYANSYYRINPKSFFYDKVIKIIFNLEDGFAARQFVGQYEDYIKKFKNIDFGDKYKYMEFQEAEYRSQRNAERIRARH